MKQAKQDFLTIPEAAEYLGIGQRTLFRYLHDGRIKAAKLGRWRFRKEDLDAFIEQSFKAHRRKR